MIAFVAAAVLAPASPSLEQVLVSVRQAVGYNAAVRTADSYEATGKAHVSGLDCDFRLVFDRDGRYVFSQSGPLGQTRGWDGKQGWEADGSGATLGIHLSDLQQQHAITWIVVHEWLDPEGPFDVTLAEAEPGADTYTLNLKQKKGVQTQRVIVDKKTWLPKRNEFSVGELTYSMEFSDWRDVNGFKVPHRLDTLEGTLKGWATISRVRKAATPNPFARPQWSVKADTTYDLEKQGVVESKLAFTGHILVHPKIDGKDVGWFILDSGAGGMAIDTKTAESLGAKRFGELNVGGVGGVVQSGYFNLKDFNIGPATVASLNFIDIDLSAIGNIFGVKLAGIVGYDFFRRAVVEVDVTDGRVAVFSPHSYGNAAAKWDALILDGRHPTVLAEFEGGKSGRFRLDTGADGTVTFNTPTVERFNMLEGRKVSDYTVAGVGGSLVVKRGRLEYFKIGERRFEDLDSTFATDKKGIFNEDFLAGNIGQGLLEPFRVVLDYANERMALVLKPEPAPRGSSNRVTIGD